MKNITHTSWINISLRHRIHRGTQRPRIDRRRTLPSSAWAGWKSFESEVELEAARVRCAASLCLEIFSSVPCRRPMLRVVQLCTVPPAYAQSCSALFRAASLCSELFSSVPCRRLMLRVVQLCAVPLAHAQSCSALCCASAYAQSCSALCLAAGLCLESFRSALCRRPMLRVVQHCAVPPTYAQSCSALCPATSLCLELFSALCCAASLCSESFSSVLCLRPMLRVVQHCAVPPAYAQSHSALCCAAGLCSELFSTVLCRRPMLRVVQLCAVPPAYDKSCSALCRAADLCSESFTLCCAAGQCSELFSTLPCRRPMLRVVQHFAVPPAHAQSCSAVFWDVRQLRKRITAILVYPHIHSFTCLFWFQIVTRMIIKLMEKLFAIEFFLSGIVKLAIFALSKNYKWYRQC